MAGNFVAVSQQINTSKEIVRQRVLRLQQNGVVFHGMAVSSTVIVTGKLPRGPIFVNGTGCAFEELDDHFVAITAVQNVFDGAPPFTWQDSPGVEDASLKLFASPWSDVDVYYGHVEKAGATVRDESTIWMPARSVEENSSLVGMPVFNGTGSIFGIVYEAYQDAGDFLLKCAQPDPQVLGRVVVQASGQVQDAFSGR